MFEHHRLRLAGVALAVALALVAALSVGPTIFASSDGRPEILAIHWKVSYQAHQATPPAYSTGDTLQATYTFTGGTTGTADFACTVVAGHFLCQGIARLPDGDIYLMSGPVDPAQPAAIIGGTRAYVGVTGEFTQQENADETGSWILKLSAHPRD